MSEHLKGMTTLTETFDTRAYMRLMEIDSVVDRIADRIASQEDMNTFHSLNDYELDAYATFCKTRMDMLKDEIKRRSE